MNTNIHTASDVRSNDVPSNDKPAYPPDWAPLRLVALVDMMCLAREAVDWNAKAFDADEPVDGADAVAFLAEWRVKMRKAQADYDADTGRADG